ncbi:hemagglutinin repeat-containing protein [Achromobacter aegrifaciens]|uniref:hemagglutinin repeat-containing protein n=1 Tax=Achromobacter aegrifaciens TaxID=1287736 RepID=UPI001581BB34|nr:hemagglutinin repeat-containing protein [Achromobacter aegrifaciens]
MSKLRSLIVWSVVFTQVWSPVLAQTLPISVDKSVAGAKPSVGVSNGVPVINIAPPSAGGVSNNRYTQFNVGPSGAVLNNSGGASQTQLAGQVGGNPMLGNQRASTILNQVTAPNPSQLLGTLEVAGNRANVIVANPAGITCNGCGFLNADRATLTTGKPQVGPDGSIGFDIASGKIRVEGAGLNGSNLSQVDLLARTLEINADVWADKLNVTAGAARVDYATGAVSAQAGEGAAPEVALDTAALGGMYANSVRLIGTEAGVGVNIGGNLVALTGDLQVTAAGDVRIAPRGTAQAAGNLRVDSGGDLSVQGAAQAGGTAALAATRDVSVQGAVGAGGALTLDAGGDVAVGAQGSLRTQGALRMAAGKDLSLSGGLLTSDQDLRAQAGRNLKVAGQAVAPQPGQGGNTGGGTGGGAGTDNGSGSGAGSGTGSGSATGGEPGKTPDPSAPGEPSGGVSTAGGVVSAKEGATLQAGRDMLLSRQVYASGVLQAQAGADAVSEAGAQLQSAGGMTIRAGSGVTLAGAALTDGAMLVESTRDLRLDGSALAYGGALDLKSGGDLRMGAASKAQGKRVGIDAARDLRADGELVSETAAELKAGREAAVDARVLARGDLDLNAQGATAVTGQVEALGRARLQSGAGISLAGSLSGNQGVDMRAAGPLAISGAVGAAAGELTLASGGDLSVSGSAQAGGPVRLSTQGALNVAGTVSSLAGLTAQAARDAAVDGKLLAGGPLLLEAIGQMAAGADSRLQSDGAMQLRAGQSMLLAGVAETNAGLTLGAGRDLRVDGAALAYGGVLSMDAGQDLRLTNASRTQGEGVSARAGGDLQSDGAMAARGDIALTAGRDAQLGGKTVATNDVTLAGGRNLAIAQGAQLEAERSAQIQAGQDATLAGAVRTNQGIRIDAAGKLRLDGETSSVAGAIDLLAGGDLSVGAQGKAYAGGALSGASGGALRVDGELAGQGALTFVSVGGATVNGKLLSGDALSLRAGTDLRTSQAAQLQSSKNMTLSAGQDASLAGAALSDGGIAINATRELRVDGSALAYGGGLSMSAGRDLWLGDISKTQGKGISVLAGRDLGAGGEMVAPGSVTLTAGRDAVIGSRLSADGGITLRAQDTAQVTGQLEATGVASLQAGGDMTLSGGVLSNQGTELRAGGALGVSGTAGAAQGALTLASDGDMTVGGSAQSGGPLSMVAKGALNVAGTVSSLSGLTAQAAGDATVNGKLLAGGPLLLETLGRLVAGADARLQSEDAMQLRAGQDLVLAGEAEANKSLTLDAAREMRVDGAALAYGGQLSMDAGNDLRLGDASRTQGEGVAARAGGDLLAEGTMASRGDIALVAGRDASLGGKTVSAGDLKLDGGRNLAIAQAAQLDAEGKAQLKAGQDAMLAGAVRSNLGNRIEAAGALRLDGTTSAVSGAIELLAGGDLTVGSAGKALAGGALRGESGGALSVAGELAGQGALTFVSVDGATVDGKLLSGDALSLRAGKDLRTGQAAQLQSSKNMTLSAGQDASLAGAALSDGGIAIDAARELRVDGGALAYGGELSMTAGSDLLLGAASKTQGKGVTVQAARDLVTAGEMVAAGSAALTAGRDAVFGAKLGADGDLTLRAQDTARVTGDLQTTGAASLQAGGDVALSGSLLSNQGTELRAGGALDVSGTAGAASGALTLASDGDMTVGGSAQSGGPLSMVAKGALNVAGTVSSLAGLTAQAGTDASVTGKLLAGGPLLLEAIGQLQAGADARLQSEGAMALRAGQDLVLAGEAETNKGLTLDAGRDVKVDGAALAYGGQLAMNAGKDLRLGDASRTQGVGVEARAMGDLLAGGVMAARGDILLNAGRDARIDSKAAATGNTSLIAVRDLAMGKTAQWDAEGASRAQAGQDMTLAGVWRGNGDMNVDAAGKLSVDGTLAASAGGLSLNAGGDLSMGDMARVAAKGAVNVTTLGDLRVAGALSSLDALTLQAARNAAVAGQVYAARGLDLKAGQALTAAGGSHLQSDASMTLAAGQDLTLAGTALAEGRMSLDASRDLRVDGNALAYGGALQLKSGNDLLLGAGSQLQGKGVQADAGRDLALGGVLVSTADAELQAVRDARVDGKLGADGALDLGAGGNLRIGAAAQLDAADQARIAAAGNLEMAGVVRGDKGASLDAGGRLDMSGTAASANGALNLKAGEDLVLTAGSRALSGGALQARAGGSLTAAGTISSLADLILESVGNISLDGQNLAAGNLALQAGGALATGANARLQADGSVDVQADSAALAGTLVAGQAATLRIDKDLAVDGTVLADAGALKVDSGGAMTLGASSALQAGGLLQAQAGGKLLANGTISGEQDITLKAGTDAELNGKTVANGTLRADAAGNLSIGQAGLAQGSSKLLLGAGQDLRIAGTAGTATGAGAAGGVLQAQAGRDLFITGTATAGSPIVLGAQRDIRIDGIATALEGGLTADAGANLLVGAGGRIQAFDGLSARAGGNLGSDGVIAAGGGLTLAATGDVLLGGLAAALGERAAGNASITAGRDLVVKQNGQLQAAGTLTARADRDLYATGALSSVGDMLLAAARDARVDGTAATDANLTLTGRDVTVGTAGLAQAGRTLTATAQGALQAAGRMLAGGSQALTAGDKITVDGTVAALQGDLSLTAQRGDIALGAASRLQAGGALTAQANGALTALGSAAAEQGMTLRAGTDATLGGIAATQTGNLVASAGGKLTITADGRLQSGAALDLSAGGALLNAGIASAGTNAKLWAGSTLDNTGSVLAGGDLIATALGQLSNAGRFVAGVGADGSLSQPGSIRLTGGSIVHGGTSLAGRDLSLSAGSLNLAGGKLSAIGKVTLATAGDVDSRNAVVQGGTLDISAANLYNQGGKLTSTGDAAIKLGGGLNNTGGVIAAAGNASIEAASIVNRDGTLAARDLTITATGAVDNRGGLIQADNVLTLNAASLDNSGTLTAAGTPPKGVLGKVVSIMADRVNNQGGSIEAIEDLTLTTKELDNTGGAVASQGNARIVADTLKNTQGTLQAGKSLTVIAQALQGLGVLQSAGDLSFAYAGPLNQQGDISSGRDLNLSVGGAMDNRAKISAGRDLSISADSLNNQASGQLLAGGQNRITVTQGLTNAGLIDGGSTRITAGRVDNTGRIYGDAVSIQAGALVNGAGAGGGAVIASRGNMDLGVGSLINRDHALIYAGADLRIGGALDAAGRAIGQAGSLLNASATIEAAGNADISAASIRNQNDRYTSETVQVSSTSKVYFTPAGTTDMYDAETNWLCDEVTPMCSKDPAWLNDDPERMFLLPSTKYPASRYGPPFDYAPSLKGKGGTTSPITPTYTPVTMVCDGPGGDAGATCSDVPEKFRYGAQERIWSVFGVTPPSGPMPVWTEPERACYNRATCDAEKARRQAYEEAYAAYKAPHMVLDARIREFNADFNSRLVGTFVYYRVQETVTETRTLSSDPGKILSGGSMTLTGDVTNDKSQIAAGGALTVAGPAINNIGAGGVRTITRTGTMTETQARSRDRKEYSSAYNATLAGQPIELPVGTSGGNVAVQLNGSKPGASNGGAAPGPVLVASVGLPGGTVVRTVSNPAGIPDSQLYTVNGRPDAPYVVATDPRFVGQRPTVSSDYLLDLLSQPGALPGTTIGNGAGSGGGLAGQRNDQPGTAGTVNAGVGAGSVSTPGQGGASVGASSGLEGQRMDGQGGSGPVNAGVGSGSVSNAVQAGATVGASGGLDGQRLDAQGASGPAGATLGTGGSLSASGATAAADGQNLSGARLGSWDSLAPAGAKFLTPSGQPKRLGDGFYEQKLVSDQILATTGQRFLDKYSDNDSQYKALLAAGAQFARDNGVQLGVALTEAQQRQLTTDLVWLVEQTVTLPDGTTETVLVPQVYLLVRAGDLKGDGTLMAGRNVKLEAEGDIVNSGTIGAREATVMTAGNIVNQGGGLIQGATVDLAAREDLTNLVSLIKGDNVALKAGRDIALTSTAASENFGSTWGTHVSGVARVDADNLNMQAGRDITLTAAQVSVKDDARLQAGRDIALETLTESHGETLVLNKKNRHDLSTSSEVGSSIAAGGNLALVAGQDVNARAAEVNSEQTLAVVAGRDINISAGEASTYARDEVSFKTRSFLSSKSTHRIDSQSSTQAQASTFSGDEAIFQAGRDFSLSASQVLANKDLTIDAGRDIVVAAGTNTYAESHYERIKKSGFSVGGLGISYKTSDAQSKQTVDGATQSDARSLLGTTGGNVILTAGRDVLVAGSDLVAGKAEKDLAGETGNIDIQGENVAIIAGRDVENTHSEYSLKQSSFGVAVVGTVIDTFKNLAAAGSTKGKVQELAHSGATNPGVTFSFNSSKSSGSFDSYSQVSSGSSLSAAGDIRIRATGSGERDGSGRALDGDVVISGSTLRAQEGVVLDAQRNIAVVGSDNRQTQNNKESSKSTSFSFGSMSLGDIGRAVDGGPNSGGVKMFPYGSESARSKELTSGTWQTSSLITGNTVSLNSRDGDIRIAGSAIDAVNNVGLTARQGSVVVDTGSATREHSSSYSSKSVGDLGREGSGFTVGVRSSSGSLDERSSTPSAAGSTITSRQGDVSIIAQDDLLIRGSDIRAGRDMLLGGQTVTIDGSYDTSVYRRFQETSQIGVTVSASNPVVSAVQSTNRMREAAQESNNGRLQAIAAVAAGLAAKNAYDAVAKDPARAGGISINVDLGASSASQTSTGQSSTASGAAIAAGRDLTIIAAGKGEQSDIIVAGSDLAAGRNVLLDAQGDLLLIAQRNTSSQKTDGKSSNASIGVGFSLGGSQQGFSINLGAGGSKSKSDGQASTWNNTHVQAGNTLTMNSGGDTVLRGAQASGDRILATVGGNLLVESLQDINSFTARDRSVGVQVSLCIPPICYGASSVSGNYGKTNIDSKYASVTEQTGLWAGDGGFQLDVAKNTGLIGAVIASSDKAVADARNVLITGTLTSRDIENRARYEGQSLQLGGGVSFGGGKEDGKDKNNVGTDGKGEAAGGSKATPNSNLPAINGVSAVPPVPMGAKGESSSTTLSGISGGKIVIRDETGQKAQTGQTAAEAIASLNRDTKDTLNSLDPIFDEKEVRAGFEIVGETGRQMGQFLANRAAEAKALSDELTAELKKPGGGDSARIAQLTDDLGDAAKWEPGGQYRLIATAILGGVTGNVTGGVSEVAKASAVNYLQGLTAQQVKLYSDALGDGAEAQAARAALHTLVGCAGGSARGEGCGASALGAGAASVVNALLDAASGKSGSALSPEDKEARSNLVSSLLAGVAVGLGADASAVVNSGRLETENNAVATLLKRGGMAALGACFRSPACEEKVIGPIAFAAITAMTADLMGKTPGLSEDQALLLAVVQYIATGGEPQSIPGKPGDPVPPVGVPPGGGGTVPDTQLPGKSGDVPEIGGVPGQENKGPAGGTTTITPIPSTAEATVIFQHGDGQRTGRPYVSSGAEVTPEIVEVALRGDPAFGVQGAVSLPAIQRYVDRLLAGEMPPPIRMDGDLIVDGNHRYIAARILGRNVEVIQWASPGSLQSKRSSISNISIDLTDWGNH